MIGVCLKVRRYLVNLLAALLTFLLGVFIATPVRVLTLNLRATPSPCDKQSSGKCNQWETTGPVSEGLGWDLTYISLLYDSGVCPGDSYCEVASLKPQPPVHKHFAEWKGEPIDSSILVELSDGHAAMFAIWLIRTKDHAYVWTFHPEEPTPGMQEFPAMDYDRAFEAMTCWQQDRPPSAKFSDAAGYVGYAGFLSLFKAGRSRQMLLTYKDFFLTPATTDRQFDESSWGRMWKTMQPIFLIIENQRQQVERGTSPKASDQGSSPGLSKHRALTPW